MVSFPPHTTHKLQPFDVSVYGPLKRYYSTSCDDWMVSNPRPMTMFDIAQVASSAFSRAFTPSNITAGFKSTGIEPFNPSIFDGDQEFIAASVTDRPAAAELDSCSSAEPAVVETPRCSSVNITQELGNIVTQPSVASTCSSMNSLEAIRPFPKAGPRKTTGRRRQKTRILTDTPVRDEQRLLEEKRSAKKSTSVRLVKRRLNLAEAECPKQKKCQKKQSDRQKTVSVRSQPGKRPVPVADRPPLPRPPTWLLKQKTSLPVAETAGAGSDVLPVACNSDTVAASSGSHETSQVELGPLQFYGKRQFKKPQRYND